MKYQIEKNIILKIHKKDKEKFFEAYKDCPYVTVFRDKKLGEHSNRDKDIFFYDALIGDFLHIMLFNGTICRVTKSELIQYFNPTHSLYRKCEIFNDRKALIEELL